MPRSKTINKDFLKQVFAGKKDLLPLNQVRPINVPHYDELSVENLIKDIMGDAELARFFPDQATKGNRPDRVFFFNVINTLQPDYLQKLIMHAQSQRARGSEAQANPNIIEVNDFWRKELEATPYFSSKLVTY